MSSESPLKPSAIQVRRQLAKIIDHALFQSSPELAKLLTFLVERTLDGRDIGSKAIATEIYGGVKNPKNPVKSGGGISKPQGRRIDPNLAIERIPNLIRQNKKNLRGRLFRYYTQSGAFDPVFILFPPPSKSPTGETIRRSYEEAYAPVFEANPLHAAAAAIDRGDFLLNQGHVHAVEHAERNFGIALAAAPNHPTALIGVAESLCVISLYGVGPGPPKQFLEGARAALFTIGMSPPHFMIKLPYFPKQVAHDFAGDDSSKSARFHVVYAVAHMLAGSFAAADEQFANARKIDETSIYNSWYALFLLYAGETLRALDLLYALTRLDVTDPIPYALYFLALDATNNWDLASAKVVESLELHGTFWFTNLAFCLYSLGTNMPDRALEYYDRLHQILGLKRFQFMPGLAMLAISRSEKIPPDDAKDLLQQADAVIHSRSRRLDLVQVSMAHMAYGRNTEAAEALRAAFDDGNPLIYWFRFLALFSPVAKEPATVELLKRLSIIRAQQVPPGSLKSINF